MVKMPSILGQLNVPRPSRGIATIDPGNAFSAQAEAGRYLKAGLDDLSQGFKSAEVALYNRKLEDEEREVKTLDVEYSKRRREITKTFYATQGENTLKARGGLDKQLAIAREELVKKGSSGRVRQAFGMLASAKTEQELGNADNYTENQRRVANNTASEAVMIEAFQAAVEDAADPMAMSLHFKSVEQEVASQGRNNGWSADVVKSKTQAARSQLYKNQVFSLAENNPALAISIYQNNKDDIDGDVRYEIEKKLADETIDTMAQSFAEEAMKLYPGSITKQRAHVREKLDGKQETATIQELDKRLSEVRAETSWAMQIENHAYNKLARQDAEDRRAEKAAVDTAADSLYEYLRANPNNTRDEWETKHPEMAKSLLKDNYRDTTLRNVEQNIMLNREFAKVTDKKTFDNYKLMDVEGLAAVTENQIEMEKANMSRADHTRFVQMIRSARGTIDGAKGANSKLYDEAQSLGKLYAPRADGKINLDETQWQSYTLSMSSYIEGQTSAGKIPTHKELEQEAQRLMLRIKSDPNPWWPDFVLDEGNEEFSGIAAQATTMSAAQKESLTVPLDKVPAPLLDTFKANLKSFNIPEDPETLEALAGAYAVNDMERWAKILGFSSFQDYAKATQGK